MEYQSLPSFHKKFVKGTEPKAIVADKTLLLCNLTKAVTRGLNLSSSSVYITTKSIKHIYDKKPAAFYDSIIQNLYKIIRFPDHIYKNKAAKTGDFCFIKTLQNKKYLCSVEVCGNEEIYVVTVFITDDDYLKEYELLWSWRDDDSPSS